MITTESTSMVSLPVELLHEIYIRALSSGFPLVCRHFYAVCKSAPVSINAQYLIGRYYEYHARTQRLSCISAVLRYPLCDQSVLEAIIKSSDCPPMRSLGARTQKTELPRRLFRDLSPRLITTGKRKRGETEPYACQWTDDDDPLPFLRYLYNHPHIPRPYTNSWDGYALIKAVHAEFIPLVHFLLEQEASPEIKRALAVTVAIRRKNISLVRTLIERDGPQRFHRRRETSKGERRQSVEGHNVPEDPSREVVESARGNGAKRRKLGDRVQVTQEMLKTAVQSNARDIVDYFMKEKGCVPDMQTVLLMGASR